MVAQLLVNNTNSADAMIRKTECLVVVFIQEKPSRIIRENLWGETPLPKKMGQFSRENKPAGEMEEVRDLR